MKYRGAFVVLLAALPLASVPGAEPEWLHLTTPNFEILSGVGARETRTVAQRLELAGGFFAGIFGPSPASAERTRVVIFRSRKEYASYRPLEAAVAHYARNSGRDYIAIANAGDGVLPSAVHELFHASARRAGWTLPLWLDEGLAEVYSTLRYSGSARAPLCRADDPIDARCEPGIQTQRQGTLYVGASIPSRRVPLETGETTPLSELLDAGHNSPEYNQKDLRQSFYNQSWALVHMLAFHPAYAPSFPGVLNRLRSGEPSKAVLEDAYRKPLKTIETELARYVLSRQLDEHRSGPALEGVSSAKSTLYETTPATPFDVSLAMLDLNNHDGSDQELSRRLQNLIAANPARPEPWISLGYYAQRHNRTGEMDRCFSRAVDLGSRNPVMLWDYASVAAPMNPKGSARALERLIELWPGDQPALLLLAEIQSQGRQFRAAVNTLMAYGPVRDADQLRYFRTMAITKSELDDRPGSRTAARRWYELAQGIEERDNADRVLKYLDSLDAIDRSARASLEPTGKTKVEVLDVGPPPLIRPSVSGQLVSFDCQREPSRLVLRTPQGPAVFLVDDFGQLTVYGLEGKAFEVTCGPQQPVAVRIQFDPAPPGQRGIHGLARAIHFEPEWELIQ